jgi:transketolase
MRVDFVKAIDELLETDPTSMFITGDLGYAALERLQAKYGSRFLNAGVAEQNMVGAAAGMALTGMRPWVYSIAPFATYRCLEQIRNDVCLHRLPVRIAGNGGGYTYGIMGSTHHALEDLAVLRPLPNMQLFFPCANDHVAAAVNEMAGLDDPSYIRLAISPYTTDWRPIAENPRTLTRHYAARKARLLPSVTIVGVGHGVQVALRALAAHGLSSQNVDVFGVARFPWNLQSDTALLESAISSRNVVVIEEHYRDGGMGESLQSALPGMNTFHTLAAAYSPDQRYGSPAFHLQQCGLTPEALMRTVSGVLEGGRK